MLSKSNKLIELRHDINRSDAAIIYNIIKIWNTILLIKKEKK
jgi:hypothetical protein